MRLSRICHGSLRLSATAGELADVLVNLDALMIGARQARLVIDLDRRVVRSHLSGSANSYLRFAYAPWGASTSRLELLGETVTWYFALGRDEDSHLSRRLHEAIVTGSFSPAEIVAMRIPASDRPVRLTGHIEPPQLAEVRSCETSGRASR